MGGRSMAAGHIFVKFCVQNPNLCAGAGLRAPQDLAVRYNSNPQISFIIVSGADLQAIGKVRFGDL
jgi:hypothetical protein